MCFTYKKGNKKMIYLTLILFFLNVTALPFSCTFSDIKIKVVFLKEEFEDTKGVIRIRKSKDRQHNGQTKKRLKDKQRSTKHYT